MGSNESQDLLQGLGSRIGLEFTPGATRAAHAITGGHPWLLRKIGSRIHKSTESRSARLKVETEDVQLVYSRTKRSFYSHVDWILNHLREVASDEYALLRDIAVGGQERFLAEWQDQRFRDAFADHLAQYGLVSFDGDIPTISIGLVQEALALPTASDFEERKRRLKETVEDLETAIRSRIGRDVIAGLRLEVAIKNITEAVPGDAKNRALDREGLQEVGESEGVEAVLQAMNWGDYLHLLRNFYPAIQWSGADLEPDTRIGELQSTFNIAHVVRHNNDAELRRLFADVGYDALLDKLRGAQEMLSA